MLYNVIKINSLDLCNQLCAASFLCVKRKNDILLIKVCKRDECARVLYSLGKQCVLLRRVGIYNRDVRICLGKLGAKLLVILNDFKRNSRALAKSAKVMSYFTAADDDRPPMGSVPWITPLRPIRSGYFLASILVAPRR